MGSGLIDGVMCSFENLFQQRSYFSGEHKLDSVLLSLIHLSESCIECTSPLGRTILVCEKSLVAQIKKKNTGKDLFAMYGRVKSSRNFDLYKFMVDNSLPVDRIHGVYPLVFQDYRRVLHVLKMSWAFYLTLRMHSLSGDCSKFPERFRNGIFKNTKKNLLTCIYNHLYVSLKQQKITEEKDIIKCLKNSLCFHVSESLKQSELPDGKRINLIPMKLRGKLCKLGLDQRVQFFFSLLQSKALCQEVPESFILDTLIKHRQQLSSESAPVSSDTMQFLRERGRSFGKLVAKYYKPNKGFSPTNKATFAFPRGKGGVKGDLVYQNILSNHTLDSDPTDRMEPFVIGLFGQPGMGKSSYLPNLLKELSSLFPGVPRDSLTYSRSCNVEFWDGYKHQPIVILDDLGQSKEGKDIKEFQTLVSCNSYVLPMADLSDKGTMFCSPIIICTSNLQYGSDLFITYKDGNGIIDDASFWRRFHVPLYVEDRTLYRLCEKANFIRHENLLMRKGISKSSHAIRTMDNSEQYFNRKTVFAVKQKGTESYKQGIWETCTDAYLSNLVPMFKDRRAYHENIRNDWVQEIDKTIETPLSNIASDYFKEVINPHLPKSLGFNIDEINQSCSHSLRFSSRPPSGPLPVRVEPVTEPLKVRTITAGIGQTFSLKPLQRAMWHALGEEEQFCLTHGTNNLETAIDKIYQNSESDDVWISGDYTAATDSFPLEATRALMEGILESIEHEPTKRWAMKEISPHLLVYPEDSGLEPVIQRSGQLMGSFLSFPLLCLLNDCTAQSIGLKSSKYLINGDDILMRTTADKYESWKEKVHEFGLKLSAGKNYIHSDFGTVNSQMIKKGKVLFSGKQKVLDRRAHILGECLRDLELMMDSDSPDEVHELFKTINRQKLSRTVRSIRVPVSHGGLSLKWGEAPLDAKSKRTEILCYLYDMMNKMEPEKGHICVPYLSNQQLQVEKIEEMDRAFNQAVSTKEYHEDLLSVQGLQKCVKRIQKHPELREKFLGSEIENLPPLNFLHSFQIPFKDEKILKEIQASIDTLFLKNFLNPNLEFTYDDFLSQFIHSVRGIGSQCEKKLDFFIHVLDLNLKPDYLTKVVSGYKVQDFSSETFSKDLGTALKPKEFNLPPCEFNGDLSLDVTTSYNVMINHLAVREELLLKNLETFGTT
jgi:hypothetical protein